MADRSGLPKLRRPRPIMLAFPIGKSGETIVFTDIALGHLRSHRQMKWWQPEACGLLFARTEIKRISIEVATGPYQRGWRTRYGCAIPPAEAQREIDERHADGLHYVGEWHSHPERVPSPSGRDEKTMQSRVLDSQHDLLGFIFVLVGQASFPTGLTVIVHDGSCAVRLSCLDEHLA